MLGAVSDIPIGTPPVPPGRHAAPSGWYPDPAHPAQERYWDGWQWTRNTRGADTGPAPAPRQYQQSYPPTATGRPAGPQRATTAGGARLSAWGWRLLAGVVDLAIIYTLSMIAGYPILRRMAQKFATMFNQMMQAAQNGQPAPTFGSPGMMSQADQLAFAGWCVGIGLVYTAVFLRLRGATPGKMVAGIRVVPAGAGAGTVGIGWPAAIVRSLLWIAPQMFLFCLVFTLVDCMFPLWQPNRQALHDLVARTQVIRTRS